MSRRGQQRRVRRIRNSEREHTVVCADWESVTGKVTLTYIHCSAAAAAAAKSLQSCPTLCDPIDSNPLSSPVPGILQARTLEWVAISLSNA